MMSISEQSGQLGALMPVVSVIVPARNEEASLGACLASLVAQKESSPEVPFEIIVIDDHSTDRTHEIAGSFPGVRIIQAGPLPLGWSGKNNAITKGVEEATGEWFLFTDADTVHLPGSLARSLAEAKQHDAVMLSYSPEQTVGTFWEKAVMPLVFAALAASFRPSEVSDPKSPAAAANGQYILIRRDVYKSVGGHSAVAGELLEDLALARKLKQAGQRIFFRYGGDAVRTRMYRGFAQLRDGWTRSLKILFARPRWLAMQIFFAWLLAWIAPFCGVLFFLHWPTILRGVAVFVLAIPVAKLYAYIHRANFPAHSELLSVAFGPPMFAYFLCRSASAHRNNDVAWKGRHYAGYETTQSNRGSPAQSSVGAENRALRTDS